jgi:hypothetical protein
MNKLLIVSISFLLLAGCDGDGEERTLSACRPSVSVTLPGARGAKAKRSAARPKQRDVVQIYWDISNSMRDFTTTRAGRSATAKRREIPALTDDLTPVVAALDSSVLLRAHANVVEQYGVGRSIETLPSARSALHPNAAGTVLHLAAERIGTALANGDAQAALVVSDMELETPPRTSAANAIVCGGVPLPSTPEAGSLFGRCFEHAVLASDGPPLTRASLLVHLFRKSTHDRELFILLLASDRAFGRRISEELLSRLDFSRQVIFDSGDVAAANVRDCSLTAPAPDVQLRNPGCSAKCFEPEAAIQAQCTLRRPAGAWIEPAGRGTDGVSYESLKKNAGDSDEPAIVRFVIPCNTPPGRFDATVDFNWRRRTPSAGDDSLAQKESVRDLFDSLSDAIIRTVAPRHMHIGIDLAK